MYYRLVTRKREKDGSDYIDKADVRYPGDLEYLFRLVIEDELGSLGKVTPAQLLKAIEETYTYVREMFEERGLHGEVK